MCLLVAFSLLKKLLMGDKKLFREAKKTATSIDHFSTLVHFFITIVIL